MIKVLIVEDSRAAQELIKHILSSDPDIEVIGTANNGVEALKFLEKKKPDVVTMDLYMPKMDGFETTRTIMETQPVPIVVVSASLDPAEVEKTWQAIGAGAVTVLEKPRGYGGKTGSEDAAKLVQTVKLMSQVKVVRRWGRLREKSPTAPDGNRVPLVTTKDQKIEIVAIGASTGGPHVLRTLLSSLPGDFALPIAVVQHIAEGFTEGFVRWLDQCCSLNVCLAENRQTVQPGHVYVAPSGFQMKLEKKNRISLSADGSENGLKPSVASLFRSIAKEFGARAVGVLVTGMGKDGAREMKLMREEGAVTIAQDKESSVVHGMPGEAIKIGAVQHVLSPEAMAQMLKRLAGGNRNG
jgi:two-component system, chemotaxis family, protein-glutamate methylesterase/glutaminase